MAEVRSGWECPQCEEVSTATPTKRKVWVTGHSDEELCDGRLAHSERPYQETVYECPSNGCLTVEEHTEVETTNCPSCGWTFQLDS